MSLSGKIRSTPDAHFVDEKLAAGGCLVPSAILSDIGR